MLKDNREYSTVWKQTLMIYIKNWTGVRDTWNNLRDYRRLNYWKVCSNVWSKRRRLLSSSGSNTRTLTLNFRSSVGLQRFVWLIFVEQFQVCHWDIYGRQVEFRNCILTRDGIMYVVNVLRTSLNISKKHRKKMPARWTASVLTAILSWKISLSRCLHRDQ